MNCQLIIDPFKIGFGCDSHPHTNYDRIKNIAISLVLLTPIINLIAIGIIYCVNFFKVSVEPVKVESIPPLPPKVIQTVPIPAIDDEEIISNGQGEFVVFRRDSCGVIDRKLTIDCYRKVYSVLYQASSERTLRSMEQIKERITKIDSSLEIVFIPKILYELILINKCIKEDFAFKKPCASLSTEHGHLKTEKCYHFSKIKLGQMNLESDLSSTAFRMNKGILKRLGEVQGHLCYRELKRALENEIVNLKNHFDRAKDIGKCDWVGPLGSFGIESIRGMLAPMPISDDDRALVIRNALALECSEVAKRAFIIYRGSVFRNDSCQKERAVQSLSFGTGLFAGALYDPGACAFYHMVNPKSIEGSRRVKANAFAIAVDFSFADRSIFYIPKATTLEQLFGSGELFHVRTKFPITLNFVDNETLRGIGGVNVFERQESRDLFNLCRSDFSLDQLEHEFQAYKERVYNLKRDDILAQ